MPIDFSDATLVQLEADFTNFTSDKLPRVTDAELDQVHKAVKDACNCPTCGAEPFHWRDHGQDCQACRAKKEKARWDTLTVEQKLDELKARMDAASPAIDAAWHHVPIG